MSVETQADRKKDEFIDNLNKSYRALAEFLDPETYGHNDYTKEAIDRYNKIALNILKIKQKIS